MGTDFKEIKPESTVHESVERDLTHHYLGEKEGAELPEAEDDPEFVAEIERRIESIRNGTAKMTPAEEVYRRIDEKLKSMRENKV